MKASLVLGGVMALMSAGQAFIQAEAQRTQTKAQANAAENNAIAMRQQAQLELQKGEINKRRVDAERDTLRRGYEQQAGANRSLLASGNVDISGGSAADSLLGNAQLFSEDMGANRYNFQLAGWEANEAARKANWQADTYSSQASWLKKSAGSLGTSLLSAGLAGGKSWIYAGMPGINWPRLRRKGTLR